MSTNSTIEWTEATWNPLVGCTKVSDGCKNCYAERMASRLRTMAIASEERGLSAGRKAHYVDAVTTSGHWSRQLAFVEEALADPLRWTRPRTVFVNSMSDLFHEQVPLSFIKRVFDVMKEAGQHQFQVLTKRPARAEEIASELPWPDNVWIGTSVENTKVTNRIDHLRRIPARIRFLSLEPLLGPLPELDLRDIHWMIVGGESGPGARPIETVWVRHLRDQALSNKVAFFFKQWGGTNKKKSGRELDGRTWDEMPTRPTLKS